MKIGVVSYSFPPAVSGVGNVVKSVYSQIIKDQSGVEVKVFSYNDGSLKEAENINGLQITRFRTPSILNGRIPLVGIDFIKSAFKFIDKKNIDQLHVHTRFSTASFFCLFIAKLKGVKVIHYEHLGSFIKGEGLLINFATFIWDMIISRLMFIFSDKIVAVSNSVKKFVTYNFWIKESKIVVIENGCDFTPLASSFKEKFEVKMRFNIFFASRLVPLKNPLLTLQSIKRLQQLVTIESPKFSFNFKMAGSGKVEKQVVKYIQDNNMEQYCQFVGKLNSTQIRENLLNSDIVVNCSLLEGFPGIVLEAIFNNNFVIATNVCGNNDIITNSKFLLNLNNLNYESLANKLHEIILHANEYSQDMDEIKQRIVENNNWSKVAKQLYLTSSNLQK